MKYKLLIIFSYIFCVGMPNTSAFGGSVDPSAKPLHLLGLINYIDSDFEKAVKPDGSILNADEHAELIDFVKTAQEYFQDLSSRLDQEQGERIRNDLKELADRIGHPKANEDFKDLIPNLRQNIIEQFNIRLTPELPPSFNLGQSVYKGNCASCHGEDGRADTDIAKALTPAPRNFLESEMERNSPAKIYNTLFTGIEGTGMVAYNGILSQEEMWSVSYYVQAMRFFGGETPDDAKRIATLLQTNILTTDDTAQLSDVQLRQKIEAGQEAFDAKRQFSADDWLRLARVAAPFADVVGVGAREEGISESSAVEKYLNETEERIRAANEKAFGGAFSQAEQLLLSAYLDKFERVEGVLGVDHKPLVLAVEKTFLDLRGKARAKDIAAYTPAAEGLLALIGECRQAYQATLKNRETEGPWGDFLSSFVIIVREGLEAFLIIAALLALLSSIGQFRAKRYIHMGWISALVCGLLTYVVFENVIRVSGLAKETVEAVTTGIAVLLLFYTGFWLLSNADHRNWAKFIKETTSKAVGGGRVGMLFSIAFIAVYREAVETVIFYSALLKLSHQPTYVLLGFVVGCATLFTVCMGIVRFNLRLPLRQFFLITSLLMVGISIILAGKTVHELIEAGLVQVTSVTWMPTIDILGIYPSLETLAGQLVLLVVALLLGMRFFFQSSKGHPRTSHRPS